MPYFEIYSAFNCSINIFLLSTRLVWSKVNLSVNGLFEKASGVLFLDLFVFGSNVQLSKSSGNVCFIFSIFASLFY